MRTSLFILCSLVGCVHHVWASGIDQLTRKGFEAKPCDNTPVIRSCWGRHNTMTNYYTSAPNTRRIVEVWLSAQEGICNQDGYERPCMKFNGTMPGTPIIANWGDNLKIHVANNMKSNGTSVHWHGVHLRENKKMNGVPGVTQCPMSPGDSFTYHFRVRQCQNLPMCNSRTLTFSQDEENLLIYLVPP